MSRLDERITAIRQNLDASRAELLHVLDQVDGRWDHQVYSDGAAWNVGQLLIHLGVSEKGMLGQAQGIAKGEEGVPADFDIERYNRRSVEKRADLSPEDSREVLLQIRKALLEWLASIEDESILDAEGRHASLRILSVESILMTIGNHERQHTQDIATALGISK